MGEGMARRWHAAGIQVVAFNRTPSKTEELEAEGIVSAAESLPDLVDQVPAPRVVYVMVPAGQATDEIITGPDGLATFLSAGDVIVDGGNSNYRDTIERSQNLAQKEIGLVDQGTSGGLLGARAGYSVMVGGSDEHVAMVEPFARKLVMEGGYIHAGPTGAGHFVKMVHNGIEYGAMQALAEGFNLLKNGPYQLDLAAVANTWQHGSILESLLLDVLLLQLEEHPDLDHVASQVSDSGEGQWTVEEALRRSVPLPVITAALFARYSSRGQSEFGDKVLSAMRLGFGGHTK
jgi:6-phosphogluconate dehydrogenase